MDVEYTKRLESIKTMEMDAKFYELKDRHVLPFIKSNSGKAVARLTYQMSKDVIVQIRSVYRFQDFVSDLGGFFTFVFLLMFGVVMLSKYQHYQNYLVTKLYRHRPTMQKKEVQADSDPERNTKQRRITKTALDLDPT